MRYFSYKQTERFVSGNKYIWIKGGSCFFCALNSISGCTWNSQRMKDFICHGELDNTFMNGNFQIEKYVYI